MKLSSKWFLLLYLSILQSHGKEIILITYDYKSEKTIMIKNIIEKRLLIPSKLITYSKTEKPCLKNKDTVMHICIKENIEKILFQNHEMLRKSFKIFLRK